MSPTSIQLPEAAPADYLAWAAFLRRSVRRVPEGLTGPIATQASRAQAAGQPTVSPVLEVADLADARALETAADEIEQISLHPWAALAPDLLQLREGVARALRRGLQAEKPADTPDVVFGALLDPADALPLNTITEPHIQSA